MSRLYYLALTEKLLFDDDIEAWQHSLVVSDVYQNYKKYKNKSIDKVSLIPEEKKLLTKNKEIPLNLYLIVILFILPLV